MLRKVRVDTDIVQKHVQQVGEWLDRLPDTVNRLAIIYHGDCDGVISAAMFNFIFREHMGKSDIHCIPVRTEQYDFAHVMSALEQLRPHATVFLDLSVQNHPDKLHTMADCTKHGLLIYDHHTEYNNRVPENTLYLNSGVTPEGHDENSPPPCLFSAKLAQQFTGSDFDWAAAIGLIAESAVDRYMPLFQKLGDQFPELCPVSGIQAPVHVQRSKFREISYAVGSAFWGPVGEYEQTAFEALTGMIEKYSPQSFFDDNNIQAGKIIQLERLVRREISRKFIETIANTYYDPHSSLRYAEIASDYRIGGVVATRMARKFRDDLIVTGQIYYGRYVIEARRGSRRTENVAKLLAATSRDLSPFSTGGHPAAAGATLPLSAASDFFIALESEARRLAYSD
jgi:single-stranded DNA-specific DHH superfamily exonuclease